MGLKNERTGGNYLSIVKGTFRTNVPENTPGSVKREVEVEENGVKIKKIKHEIINTTLDGKLVAVKVYDTNFGKQLAITIVDDKTYTVQTQASSTFAQDFFKKLPNIDLDKIVKIKPFDFEDDNGKRKQGFSITQDGEKVKNFFYDESTRECLNGYPEPSEDRDNFDKDDWKVYFIGVNKFLQNYAFTNIIPKLADVTVENHREERASQVSKKKLNKPIEYPTDDINPEDIPF